LRLNTPSVKIIATCTSGSAAVNRNIGLSYMSRNECVVMIDDDVTGFFPGWYDKLVTPLLSDMNIAIIAARLLRPDGRLAYMMGENYNLEEHLVNVIEKRVPTACIAFIHEGISFDESFVGSGFEDTDFCKQFAVRYPKGKFVVNNDVRLIHKNEMKCQKGEYWKKNQSYFVRKWPEEYDREYGGRR